MEKEEDNKIKKEMNRITKFCKENKLVIVLIILLVLFFTKIIVFILLYCSCK